MILQGKVREKRQAEIRTRWKGGSRLVSMSARAVVLGGVGNFGKQQTWLQHGVWENTLVHWEDSELWPPPPKGMKSSHRKQFKKTEAQNCTCPRIGQAFFFFKSLILLADLDRTGRQRIQLQIIQRPPNFLLGQFTVPSPEHLAAFTFLLKAACSVQALSHCSATLGTTF